MTDKNLGLPDLGPDYYWSKAFDELSSPAIRSIAEEVPCIYRPGPAPWACLFGNESRSFAKAQFSDMDAFLVEPITDRGILADIEQQRRYDLYSQDNLEAMIEWLRELRDFA